MVEERKLRYITGEEHDYIIKYKDKKRHSYIANDLGRHPNVILQYLRRSEGNNFIYVHPKYSMKRPYFTWEVYEKVVNLFLHSKDNREKTIAKKTGLHLQAVCRILNEYFDKTWA